MRRRLKLSRLWWRLSSFCRSINSSWAYACTFSTTFANWILNVSYMGSTFLKFANPLLKKWYYFRNFKLSVFLTLRNVRNTEMWTKVPTGRSLCIPDIENHFRFCLNKITNAITEGTWSPKVLLSYLSKGLLGRQKYSFCVATYYRF